MNQIHQVEKWFQSTGILILDWKCMGYDGKTIS